ncbi:GtrA family protein [Pediococcus argentinicus]|uniref:GtrA family protein n=1 Tax=Pediococcus argentinicus TaxID=480391 RepID=UPI00070F2C39|nr:GtrA family protein [Pediococcus argentinicus]NKZ21608.1 GtrA family protein [Pediococcus argentinicus]GEP18809.1 membrane protein [Pediococcus argentinicus]
MLINLFNKYKSVISYLFWGVITTLVNIVSYIIFDRVFHVNYQVSTVIAWFLSVLTAYVTNKLWVFNSKTETTSELLSEMTKFFTMRVATLLIEMFIMWIGVSLLKWDSILVKIIDNVVVVVSNYFFSKILVFRSSGKIK